MSVTKLTTLVLAFFTCACFATSVEAASATYQLMMSGDQEVPVLGDPDGSATGTITLDDATGLITWDIVYANIAAPTAMHIHGPDGSAGNRADVFIGLNVDTTGGDGTLISSLTAPMADVSTVLGDPMDFYLNIHNDDFPGGAVRGQLGIPEPSSATLLLTALASLFWLRRR